MLEPRSRSAPAPGWLQLVGSLGMVRPSLPPELSPRPSEVDPSAAQASRVLPGLAGCDFVGSQESGGENWESRDACKVLLRSRLVQSHGRGTRIRLTSTNSALTSTPTSCKEAGMRQGNLLFGAIIVALVGLIGAGCNSGGSSSIFGERPWLPLDLEHLS